MKRIATAVPLAISFSLLLPMFLPLPGTVSGRVPAPTMLAQADQQYPFDLGSHEHRKMTRQQLGDHIGRFR